MVPTLIALATLSAVYLVLVRPWGGYNHEPSDDEARQLADWSDELRGAL